MNTHPLPDWRAFETKIHQFRQEKKMLKRKTGSYVSNLLFRGQSDSAWHLETTLDREHVGMSLGEYLDVIERVRPCVEQKAARSWPCLREEVNGLRLRGL